MRVIMADLPPALTTDMIRQAVKTDRASEKSGNEKPMVCTTISSLVLAMCMNNQRKCNYAHYCSQCFNATGNKFTHKLLTLYRPAADTKTNGSYWSSPVPWLPLVESIQARKLRHVVTSWQKEYDNSFHQRRPSVICSIF